MAKEEIPLADLLRDFLNCVVMYKNSPVFILAVSAARTVRLKHLISQKIEEVKFSLDLFEAPLRRLGFVNSGLSCVYITRIPVRKYYMGISQNNISIQPIAEYDEARAYEVFQRDCKRLQIPEIGNSLLNNYPSLEDALKTLREFKGAIAFDKQFAVSYRGRIYYKTELVGTISLKATSVKEIVWKEDKKHLFLLLEKNYEKTSRITRSEIK